MKRSQIPLTALRAFEAAVRCGSVGGAAAELGVTHGAVSKQLAQLQERAARRLFDRTAGGIRPTEEAALFASRLGTAFETLERACSEFVGGDEATEALHVLAPASFGMQWLIPRLRGFWEPRGEPPTEVQTTHTSDNWLRFRCDLAIRRNYEPIPGFVATLFLEERNTLIAEPRLAAQLAREGLAGLRNVTLLSSGSRPCELEDWLETAGLASVRFCRRQRFGHFYLLLQAVLTGQGVAVGPMPVLMDLVRTRRLGLPFADIATPAATYALVVPETTRRDARIGAFRNWLIAEAAKSEQEAAGVSHAASPADIWR